MSEFCAKHGAFPPGGIACDELSEWNHFKEVRDSLVVQLSQPLNLSDHLHQRERIDLALAPRQSKRVRQIVKLRTALRGH